ncbi:MULTISPECIES: hypothetical protein [unclassified Bradyrhizobium]|uniref:hypothetical protein n=1 Tax=unclassified Bradyrhizobium TaxID=2631580 RepID=UPI0013EE702C|nr:MULTISPECIES: hypothetical protein [unclassified Bradyrhizobium]MDI4231422.1 hypothetical protein [Bradyrhizobium sp. Arg237L]
MGGGIGVRNGRTSNPGRSAAFGCDFSSREGVTFEIARYTNGASSVDNIDHGTGNSVGTATAQHGY